MKRSSGPLVPGQALRFSHHRLALWKYRLFLDIEFRHRVQSKALCGVELLQSIRNHNNPHRMDTEIGRTVISAIAALSGMVNAYRSRTESSKVLAAQEATVLSPSTTDPWRLRTEAVIISPEELDQIVSQAEASPEAGKALASIVPENLLREILEHIDSETARLQESIIDTSRSKARRQRDLDHAEAEICVELKTIKRHNNNIIPDVPQRTLAKLWQQYRCS